MLDSIIPRSRRFFQPTPHGPTHGLPHSWIARRGTSTSELLEVAGRRPTGERHDIPDVAWYLLELPDTVDSPWVLLIADGSKNFSELDGSHAEALSRNGNETLYFWCSDTVMATELICFQDNAEVWGIEVNDDTTKQPGVRGDLPAVAREMIANSDPNDLYDIAAEVAYKLVGFRHDTNVATADPEPFQVLDL